MRSVSLPIAGFGCETKGSFLAKCCHERLRVQVGLVSALPQLRPHFSLCLLTAASCFFPAGWLVLVELYRLWCPGWRGRGSALRRCLPKRTNPPTVPQGSHPTCFALGLVTCLHSFTEAVCAFLRMVALQKAEEMTNTFAGIFSLCGLYPRSRAWQVQTCCHPGL